MTTLMGSRCASIIPNDARRGAALISALAVALTLAGFTILILRSASEARFHTRRATESLQAEAALETVFAELLLRLDPGHTGEIPIRYGEAVTVETTRGPVEAVITSPSGRVDLNTASPFLLSAIARAAGMEDADAAALGDAIADWRDGDDLTHLNGAERDDYIRAGLEGPANRPFRSVAELRGVLGMEEALFNCMMTQVTIATGSASPDLAHASPWLKAALGLNDAPVSQPPLRLVPGEIYQMDLREMDGRRFAYSMRILFRPSGDPAQPLWIHQRVFETAREAEAVDPCLPVRETGFAEAS